MTMNVTVKTYDHEAVVQRINPEDHQPKGPAETVPANEERVFHVHQTMGVVVTEKLDD